MTTSSKRILLIAVLFCPPLLIMLSWHFCEPSYLVSSGYKLLYLLPIFYRVLHDKKAIGKAVTEGFSFSRFKQNLRPIIIIALVLAGIYLGVFLLLQHHLDFQSIVNKLKQSSNITTTNIIIIGVYIIACNSLLEEFFWRGFMFKELRTTIPLWVTHALTGIAFSFHHAMSYQNWFGWGMLALVTGGLIGYAIIMNLIFTKYKDVFSCWLVHIAVDTVQITIALKLFGVF